MLSLTFLPIICVSLGHVTYTLFSHLTLAGLKLIEQLMTWSIIITIVVVWGFEIRMFRWKDVEVGKESAGVLEFSP